MFNLLEIFSVAVAIAISLLLSLLVSWGLINMLMIWMAKTVSAASRKRT